MGNFIRQIPSNLSCKNYLTKIVKMINYSLFYLNAYGFNLKA